MPSPPASPIPHYVYMLRCANGALYTGYTLNVPQRLAVHNAGKGARYTRAHRPVSLVCCWSFRTKREALQVEYWVKQLSRASKEALVSGILLPGWLESGIQTAAG